MNSLAIIGAQWGDEGKGKITDLLSKKCHMVVRYQGGNNAGHTIVVDGKTTILHIIPSGIMHKNCLSIISHGVVFDPVSFKEELDTLLKNNVEISPANLKISENCPVITSYHKLLDKCREQSDNLSIGTTCKGIGPTYEDKVSRRGLRVSDLLNKDKLANRLKEILTEKQILFKNYYNVKYPSIEKEIDSLYKYGQEIKPFTCNTMELIQEAFENNKKILYEGAQGILLDIDYGTYPFVTSSNTSIAGIYTGVIPCGKLDHSLAITKAYTTRVGEGEFPTELTGEMANYLQTKGHEFGATTGRTRRCGWMDIPLLKYAIKISNINSIALTKVDILSGIEKLKICYAYKYQGRVIDCIYPGIDLSKVEPLYKDIKPFKDNFLNDSFSNELRSYIETIETMSNTPVGILAYGAERDKVLMRRDYFN